MVKPDNLADKLGSFGHETVSDRLIHRLKPVTEGLLNVADPVQLRIVRTHDCAVDAQQLLRVVTVVSQWLSVQHAGLLLGHVRIQNEVLRSEGTFSLHAHSTCQSTIREDRQCCRCLIHLTHVTLQLAHRIDVRGRNGGVALSCFGL